ncbi:MAG: metalloregulator ArsR/SmtB family transcription factor [Actinobacteria bacterium]|nr:metalloregulator ArsR/SmtB family transcription factor [Actinomycetota bacterium]
MGSISSYFRAISDPTRQKILLLLEERERSVGELVSEFSLCQPTISRHLNVLKQAGLVGARREGQQVYYSLDCSTIRQCCTAYFSRFSCCSDFFLSPLKETSFREGGEPDAS